MSLVNNYQLIAMAFSVTVFWIAAHTILWIIERIQCTVAGVIIGVIKITVCTIVTNVVVLWVHKSGIEYLTGVSNRANWYYELSLVSGIMLLCFVLYKGFKRRGGLHF